MRLFKDKLVDGDKGKVMLQCSKQYGNQIFRIRQLKEMLVNETKNCIQFQDVNIKINFKKVYNRIGKKGFQKFL